MLRIPFTPFYKGEGFATRFNPRDDKVSRLTVFHVRGHDSLSLAVFNGIVLWGATDQTGTGYRVPLVFESDIRSGGQILAFSAIFIIINGLNGRSIQEKAMKPKGWSKGLVIKIA
jgi:hypothetical protein